MLAVVNQAAEGIFENFVNIESQNDSSTEDQLCCNILRAANEVAHKMEGFNFAEIGGSQKKHTDVSGYSDLDIKVHSEVVVTRKFQKQFCQMLVTKAQEQGVKLFGSYKRKLVAVTFDFGRISVDLVFTNPGKWCPKEKLPTLAPCKNRFHNKPEHQRVVRAFKMLVKHASTKLVSSPSLDLIH
jgi:hypothetical protein